MDPSTSPGQARRRPGDVIVTVLFALLLLAPAALALAGRAGADADFIYHHEMRYPFVAPAASTGALATGGWQRDVERQIGDGFPLRRTLVERYDLAKYAWLGDVASTHVVRGFDGWLFYGDEERSYDDGTYAPSAAQLAKLADIYTIRADWCARRGIAYVFALVPNKSTVYARYLPASIAHVTPTAGERLMSLLRTRGVRAIDLRTALNQASAKGDVYSKGETHWNDAGAYVAYREIAGALRDAGVRDTIAPESIARRISLEDGDLDRLAGISSSVPDQVVVFDFPHRAHAVPAPVYPADPVADQFQRGAYAVDDPRLPKGAVVFGDSFSLILRRFIAEDFRRTVVLQHEITHGVQFDRAAIEAEMPTVVIQELIERSLVYSARFEP
jgi:alginate O-acetyltransferase complex protein AlgJ